MESGIKIFFRCYTALLQLLRVRTKINGDDLVGYAEIVTQDPDRAEQFEETLSELRALLTPDTVDRLGSIEFLRSSTGELIAPRDAYIRLPRLVHVIGEETPYVLGRRESLYRKLGCRTRPSRRILGGWTRPRATTR